MATKQSATLLCAAIDKNGEPYTTQIVTFISPGLPYFSIIGMPDTFLSGARERIHTAMGAQGFAWPATRVTANIMPASRHKDGRAHELAVTASIMCASGILDPAMFDHAALIGRLDDDGDWHSGGRIQRVEHLPELVRHLATQDVRTIIIPAANKDVEPIDGVRFIRVSTLADLTSIDEGTLPACDHIDRLVDEARNLMDTRQEALLDACVRELEDAVDTLNSVIEQEERDPNARESAAIAEAEQTIDELQDQLDTLNDKEREDH